MFISDLSKLNSGTIQISGKITGSFEKGYNLSLGLHDSQEKIKFTCFQYQKEKSAQSILENAYLYGKIHTQPHVPIEIKDPEKGTIKTVYIPASLEASLKAVASSYFANPSQDGETELAFLQTVAKVEKTIALLRKNEYFLLTNKTSIQDPSKPDPQTIWKESILWNTKKGWKIEPVTSYRSGGFCRVVLTENVAMRYLRNQNDTDTGARLIQAINPRGDLTGIQKPKIGTALTYYDIDANTIEHFSTDLSVNKRCLGDCTNTAFSAQEIPKMCARLIEAVKTLHSKGIYHLDIKPSNILYDGNGVVYLSDFDGAISDVSKEDIRLMFTPYMVDYLDYEQLENLSSMTLDEKSLLFSKMDVFALGATFYQIAAIHIKEKNPWPYNFIIHSRSDAELYFANALIDQPSLRETLERVYNQDQTNMILKMLSQAENRPSAGKIATVFPSTLFSSDTIIEKNYLEDMKKPTVPPPPMIKKITDLTSNILSANPIKVLDRFRVWDFPRLLLA